MTGQLLMIYVIYHMFFFVATAYIYTKLSVDITKKVEYIFFRAYILSYQFFIISESVWSLQQSEMIRLGRCVNMAVNCMLYSSVVITAYVFYIFSIARMGSAVANTMWFRVITTIPVTVQMIFIMTSAFTGSVFVINERGTTDYKEYFFVIPVLSIFYLLIIIGGSLKKTITSRSYVRRKTYITQFISVLGLLGCVLADSQFDGLSILPMAIFACIFTIFINLQESGIYGDVLTGMNNRRKANEYLGEQLMNVTEKNPLYIYMCDINSFKQINDIYGHAEGDRALILTAMAIKKCISKYQGFAARFGGDEFILGWRPNERHADDPDVLMKDLQEQIKNTCKNENKPYEITISIGYFRCNNPKDLLGDCIKKADAELYKRKREFHSLNK